MSGLSVPGGSADEVQRPAGLFVKRRPRLGRGGGYRGVRRGGHGGLRERSQFDRGTQGDRKSTSLNSKSPCNLVCRLLLEKKKKNTRKVRMARCILTTYDDLPHSTLY